jgi:signal transduction histidine kinase
MRSEDHSGELLSQLRHSLHELNNALTPILANAQLAQLMLDGQGTEVREAVDDVVEAAGRANALVAEMRQLARTLHDTLEGADSDPKEVDDG